MAEPIQTLPQSLARQTKNLPPGWKEFLISLLQDTEIQKFFSHERTLFFQEGIAASVAGSLLVLEDRHIPPTETFLPGEFRDMFAEILEIWENLAPPESSNWREECFAYGEKKAYHWDWKHFGSQELF